uniref:Uncharacterized protein n=1 Tax=Fagus sylvatica TaxID=28930 RepID=A0A2N9I007_FAGSY
MVHTSSNLNGFRLGGIICLDPTQMGLWSDQRQSRWCTRAVGKWVNQSGVATAQSSLLPCHVPNSVVCPGEWRTCIIEVNESAIIKYISEKLHLMIGSEMFALLLFNPHQFVEVPQGTPRDHHPAMSQLRTRQRDLLHGLVVLAPELFVGSQAHDSSRLSNSWLSAGLPSNLRRYRFSKDSTLLLWVSCMGGNFFHDLLVGRVLGPPGPDWVVLVISPRMVWAPLFGGGAAELTRKEEILAVNSLTGRYGI